MTRSTIAPTSATGNSSPKRRSLSPAKPASPGKGKGKNTAPDVRRDVTDDDDDEEEEDVELGDEEDDEDEDDEDDEDDEMDEDEEDEEEEGEDTNKERIDPKAILPPGARRSTRGKKVDYTSEEALKRAGLPVKAGAVDEDTEMQQ